MDGAGADTIAFYDGLAGDYHLVYADRWDGAVTRQGRALARLITTATPGARDVLDCSCGIGTQAIGLALQGYRVTGTDVSEASLRRARREATRLGAELHDLARADFRDLSRFTEGFDVVLSCDNALPHMLRDDDLVQAVAAMTGALRPGGLLVISTRDYDAALRERAPAAVPTVLPGSPRRVVVRLQDWDGPDSPLHTVRFLMLTEGGDGWEVAEHAVRYRALGAEELAGRAREAGLEQVQWHGAETVGFHQPVMTARRPGGAHPIGPDGGA